MSLLLKSLRTATGLEWLRGSRKLNLHGLFGATSSWKPGNVRRRKIRETTALFKFMDLSSLDAVGDKNKSPHLERTTHWISIQQSPEMKQDFLVLKTFALLQCILKCLGAVCRICARWIMRGGAALTGPDNWAQIKTSAFCHPAFNCTQIKHTGALVCSHWFRFKTIQLRFVLFPHP